MSYSAPIKDMLFVINELAGLAKVNTLPGCEEATADTVEAVLEENARFCSEVIAPLNHEGDKAPSTWADGKVTTTKGFKEAFKSFAEAGWQGVQHPPEFGGQGLPKLVATPCIEMLNSANLSFALCPLLTDGAIEALMTAGTEEQQQTFIPNLISGKWTGTMNLTEPQAGSDLSLIRTRAVAQGDGTYKLSGTKIFITYGEHDMAENIIHFVLARTPNAPEGVKGISLFIVPKILVKADGSLGERNDVECVSIEHKLGIKASPTAVLQFGDHGGAIGTLIGEENRGLEYMFIMMNAARFAVGVQGLALAERAYQKAVQYAKDRIQSRDPDGGTSAAPIIRQPDVRRMLMSMRAQTEAGRALAYVTAAAFDLAHHHPEESERNRQRAFYELMVPVVKGWCTEMSVDVASTGVQVHGGMGFVEETGAAQFYRDARILPIYEGTTAIQANDLVGRKTVRDGGAAVRDVIARITETETQLKSAVLEDIKACGIRLSEGRAALEKTVEFILANAKSEPKKVLASGVTYLKLAGIVIGGWQMARAALAAERLLQAGTGDASFCRAKIATALFFARHVLPLSSAHSIAIVEGADDSNRLADDVF